MSLSGDSEYEERNRDRSRRGHDRERRSDRDRDRERNRERDRDRDRGRDRDRSRDHERDRDRSRDRDREGRSHDRDRDRSRSRERRDREYRERSNEREWHSRHSRESYEQFDESEESHESDDWPARRRPGAESRGKWNDSIPNNIILMRGLPSEAVESDIMNELMKNGNNIKDVRLMRSKETGYSLRYCFVEFHTIAEAQYWMESNQGEMMFWDKYPVNMYYSTSRRGNIIAGQTAGIDTTLLDSSADWTCIKCSCKNFQRRTFCRRCNHSRLEIERVTGGDGLDQVGSNPCNTLIFRGLDGLTTEENLITVLASLTSTPLKNVYVVHDRLTGASSGYAFVELNSLKESQDLLEFLENMSTPFEVDGKALIVSYAKNTFSTAIATLEQGYTQGSSDFSQQGYYDSNLYYNYGAADSHNAAEVAQAAILASQQKKQKQTAVPTPAVVSAAPVIHKPAQVVDEVAASTSSEEYPKYPVPDVSTYQYDETSGFYYDPTTGLYYDANSQYYFNNQTQQYMYWDGEKQTYLPAPTSSTESMATGEITAQEDESKKRPPSPEKKVKIAKRIVKDMEKWAKKLNAQRDQLKDMSRTTVTQAPPVAEPILSAPGSATADAGFSLLEKTVYSKKAVEPTWSMETAPSTSASTLPLYSKAEMESPASSSMLEAGGSSGAVMSVDQLIDWNKLACLLCRRAFPSKDVLVKHQQMSELHKKNVEDLILAKGGGLSQDGSTLQYRDRAKERREKYGQPEPPQPKRSRHSAVEEPIPFEQPTAKGIKDDNIGNKLLQKMGWKDGQGLGQRGHGIVDPIEAKQRHAQAGLGARGSAYNVDPSVGTYKERARKTFYHYFQEIN